MGVVQADQVNQVLVAASDVVRDQTRIATRGIRKGSPRAGVEGIVHRCTLRNRVIGYQLRPKLYQGIDMRPSTVLPAKVEKALLAFERPLWSVRRARRLGRSVWPRT